LFQLFDNRNTNKNKEEEEVKFTYKYRTRPGAELLFAEADGLALAFTELELLPNELEARLMEPPTEAVATGLEL